MLCKCDRCVSLCRRNPGWMTPEEAQKAIEAGFAKSLMRDWLEPCDEVGNEERIYLLAPASEGCEGQDAPEFDFFTFLTNTNLCKGPCVLLEDGLCKIHDSGFKPIQCRENHGHGKDGYVVTNYDVAKLWDTEIGKQTLANWEILI